MNTRIVFSPTKRRPGCVLLQVAFGGDIDPDKFQMLFPVETWLTGPTDDMGAYPLDEIHNLEALSKIAWEATREEALIPHPR